MEKFKKELEFLREIAGNSTEDTQKAVQKAFKTQENMNKCAEIWYTHNMPYGIFVLFATAVDLGYRIAKKETG